MTLQDVTNNESGYKCAMVDLLNLFCRIIRMPTLDYNYRSYSGREFTHLYIVRVRRSSDLGNADRSYRVESLPQQSYREQYTAKSRTREQTVLCVLKTVIHSIPFMSCNFMPCNFDGPSF